MLDTHVQVQMQVKFRHKLAGNYDHLRPPRTMHINRCCVCTFPVGQYIAYYYAYKNRSNYYITYKPENLSNNVIRCKRKRGM